MKITRSNYEEFFIDYIEGKLSEGLTNEFELFLNQNPDLKVELEQFEILKITPTEDKFVEKDNLKKSIKFELLDHSKFEELCISKIEGELSILQVDSFNECINTFPDKKIEYELFTKSKIVFDSSLTIGKDKIKKLVGEISDFDANCIAFIENNLTVKEAADFIEDIQFSEQKLKNFELFKKTKLIADSNIVFENKKSLKRHTLIPTKSKRIAWFTISSAAAIILCFGLLFKFDERNITRIQSSKINNIYLKYSKIDNTTIAYEIKEKKETAHNKNKLVAKVLEKNKIEITENEQKRADISINFAESKKVNFIETSNFDSFSNTLVLNKLATENKIFKQETEFLTVSEYIAESFKKKLLNGDSTNEKATFWVIAEASISKIANFLDSDFQLNNKYDENGKLETFAFEGENFAFVKPVK